MVEHTLQDRREVGFTHVFWSVAFLEALDLLRVVGEFLRDAREFRALSTAKLHFVELQNVFPSLIRNVRFAVLRLIDWDAGRGLKEERDVARSDFLVGHEVFHTKDDLEAEFVAFEEAAHGVLVGDFDQHVVDLLHAHTRVDLLLVVFLAFFFHYFGDFDALQEDFHELLERDVVHVVGVTEVDNHKLQDRPDDRHFGLLFALFVDLDFVFFGAFDGRLDLFGLAFHFRQHVDEFLVLEDFFLVGRCESLE